MTFSKVCPALDYLVIYQLPDHQREEMRREILPPPFSLVELSLLASILKKTGRQKAEENGALSLNSPDPGPQSEATSSYQEHLLPSAPGGRAGRQTPWELTSW